LPPGPESTAFFASAAATGALKFTRMEDTGVQSASSFSRSQVKLAEKTFRVLNGSTWSWSFTTPLFEATPRPQTSVTAEPAGKFCRA